MSLVHRLHPRAAFVAALLLLVGLLTAPTSASARDPGRSVPPPASTLHRPLPAAPATTVAARPKPPAAPAAPTATRFRTTATVTWKAPASPDTAITGYAVTAYRDGKKTRSVSFDASTTSRKVSGLTARGSYTFTVAAKNVAGTSPASPRSKAAKLLALPGAPTIIAVTADTASAVLSWTPGPDGGSPITGYEVHPYVGGVRQAAQSFGPATTNTVTGLLPTTTYTFTVAARTAAGTGPESAQSAVVTANVSPTLLFDAPTDATVGIAYVATLNVTHGVPPFTWSVASGALPPGLILNPVTNGISGVPTTAGQYPVVIRVVDAAARSGTRLIVLTVNQAPTLVFPPPPLAEVDAIYADLLTVVGGTAPFVWGLADGSMPPGLTLDPATGLISGRPTFAGTYPATIRVTDANGFSATKPIRLVVQPQSVVTLTASTNATTFGTPVHFEVVIGPGQADGAVTLIDALPNGIETRLGTFPVALNRASFDLQMPAFGLNQFRVQYDGVDPNAEVVSNSVTVEVSALREQLEINQFAQSGLTGLADQYVTVTNTTALDLPIAGFRIEAPGGVVVVVPGSARPLPPRRGFLVVGPTYSLPNIQPDLVVSGLGQGGLRLVAPDTAHTVTDAAGSTPGFVEGTPLPTFGSPPFVNHAWVRLSLGGKPQDTNDNAADFRLVATVLGPINGVPSALGTPSPQNSLGTYQQNTAMQSTLLDPGVAQGVAPNRVRVNGSPGTLIIRRTLTNRSSAPITQARVRITALSQENGAPLPGGSSPAIHSNMRLVNPVNPTSSITISTGQTLLVRNLSMDAPATSPPGGGLATTLTVPFDLGGLRPGGQVHIALTFAVDTPGTFWIAYDIDALGTGDTPTIAGAGKAAKKAKAATSARQRALDARRLAESKKLSLITGTVR
ncbi:fibronectin type III domain-containing protein [Micromonospora sp. RL09-050-HVF-A]|uniref:fibronectin type III domain-containing protein n=1 Tax=Micromonospora sp. RL09-050-HVF-A TaxID=1703433 RepID=UPI001C5EE91D|nr:fibronectin type III domain-containing protein [Micromonospora sp. RL09-050-HVF-A]MBW4701638.1 fibronectin type III domain-containing protein [Micromonospora sp. RL09-050-HVF-A]